MEVFDIVIMAVGAILLLTGLYLFISGKRNEESQSHVEGFGVKLNISNPSVLLIVFGIGLMLVPRLLPNPTKETLKNPIIDGEFSPTPETELLTKGTEESQPEKLETDTTQPKVGLPAPKQETLPTQPAVNIFMPSGVWQLADYEENGINLSSNIRGEIQFQSQSPNQTYWQANYQLSDIWGNVSLVQYNGNIIYNGSAYLLQILQSNDPAFIGQNTVNLDMKMEPGNRLHMEYVLNGSNTIVHWVQ